MRRFAAFAFGFAGGVFAAQYFLPLSVLPPAAAAVLLLGLVGFFFRDHRRMVTMLVSLGAAFGLIWNFGYDTLVFSHARDLDGETRTVEAVVVDFPVERDYGAYVDLRVTVEGAVDLKARAYVFRDVPEGLRPGDRIRLTADFSTADHVEDTEITSYTSKGYFLFASDAREVELLASPGLTVTNFHRYAAKAIREQILEIFPLGTEGFMMALLTGDRSLVSGDAALSSAMERTGVTHVIAVSGMHVSILTGFIYLLFGRRRGALFAAAPVLLMFMGISGFSASVVRAVVMQLFVLTAPLIMRESDSVTSLSAALFLLLLINPYAVAGAGLQLSFAATLGIILFTPRLNGILTGRLPKNRWGRLLRPILSSFAVTGGALVLTLPISAYYFRTMSLVAPVVNLLILWAITPAFITGFLAVAAAFLWMPAGRLIAYLPAVLVRLVITVIRLFARPYYAAVALDGPALTVWFILVYGALLLIATRRLRLRRIIPVGSLAAVSLCLILVGNAVRADLTEGYTLTALDVGQGQSLVLVAGEYTAVIDCGSLGYEDAGEIAERYIRSLGRDRVDMLILTHYHADHVSGVERLMRNMTVGALLVPEPRFEESTLDEEILSLAEDLDIEILYITQDTAADLGDTTVTLFPPLGKETENERGLCVLLASGGFETLITGDADSAIELQLVGKYALPDVECLVVGHHGSKYSTSEALLAAITPEVAVISVGENTYGHPAQEVLDRLAAYGVEVFRTDELGNITIESKRRFENG